MMANRRRLQQSQPPGGHSPPAAKQTGKTIEMVQDLRLKAKALTVLYLPYSLACHSALQHSVKRCFIGSK